MRTLITLILISSLLQGCEKDDPQPFKKNQDNYDRVEMEKVRDK